MAIVGFFFCGSFPSMQGFFLSYLLHGHAFYVITGSTKVFSLWAWEEVSKKAPCIISSTSAMLDASPAVTGREEEGCH